jgi:hypothetical protein
LSLQTLPQLINPVEASTVPPPVPALVTVTEEVLGGPTAKDWLTAGAAL